jgi:hypothetical protein
MRWFRPKRTGPPDESTRDRQELLLIQKSKLRKAQTLAATLRAHDRMNHYSQRLRRAYALAEEGNR